MLGTRAVIRPTEAGVNAKCKHCVDKSLAPSEARIKFESRQKRKQHVICNVYVDGAWHHVELFHLPCYEAAGEPHGPAVDEEVWRAQIEQAKKELEESV